MPWWPGWISLQLVVINAGCETVTEHQLTSPSRTVQNFSAEPLYNIVLNAPLLWENINSYAFGNKSENTTRKLNWNIQINLIAPDMSHICRLTKFFYILLVNSRCFAILRPLLIRPLSKPSLSKKVFLIEKKFNVICIPIGKKKW